MLREGPDGRITFEYDSRFRASGLEISPIHLPADREGPVSFPELARKPAFAGLPGVFADALPDQFGNAVIHRYFEERGQPGDALSPLQRLLYIGDRAMGALEFRPPLDPGSGTEEALEVRDLVDQARRVIEGDVSVAVPEIMAGRGQCGRRPGEGADSLESWDRSGAFGIRVAPARRRTMAHQVRRGHQRGRGTRGWLPRGARGPGGASSMPTRAWREMRESTCPRRISSMTETGRISWCGGSTVHPTSRAGSFRRFHFHSLGGLQHVDFNDQYVFSYEGWFDTMRAIGLGQRSVNEAFRRMVFAVATVNFDDHVKNFGFLMNPAGRWRLAPAYDVTYAENNAWTRQHQMSVNGKFRSISRRDLLEVGELFDVPKGGRDIVEQVAGAVGDWRRHALGADVPDEMMEWIESRLRRMG